MRLLLFDSEYPVDESGNEVHNKCHRTGAEQKAKFDGLSECYFFHDNLRIISGSTKNITTAADKTNHAYPLKAPQLFMFLINSVIYFYSLAGKVWSTNAYTFNLLDITVILRLCLEI